MEIAADIRRQFAELKREVPGAQVYTVAIFSPSHVLALVVPPGSDGRETTNPVGKEVSVADFLNSAMSDDSDVAWGLMTAPTLTLFTAKPARERPAIERPQTDAVRH